MSNVYYQKCAIKRTMQGIDAKKKSTCYGILRHLAWGEACANVCAFCKAVFLLLD